MRSYLKIAAALALVALVAVITYQYIRIKRLIDKGQALAKTTQAFERIDPGADFSMLLIGDSSAVGVGAATPEESVAGRFGAAHPAISITNRGRNGERVSGLVRTFTPDVTKDKHYDLLLIQIGGNDVTHFTNLKQVEADLKTVLERAKTISQNVFVINGGDFITAPIWPWPINRIFSWRYHKIRDLFLKTVPANGATYVDVFAYEEANPVPGPHWDFYAVDGFHPNGLSYQEWFKALEFTLEQSALKLP
jgi:lysophospholipase L1-like esterase